MPVKCAIHIWYKFRNVCTKVLLTLLPFLLKSDYLVPALTRLTWRKLNIRLERSWDYTVSLLN